MLYLTQSKKFFLIEGTISTLLGILAIAWPAISSLTVEVLFGWVLILAGIAQLFRIVKVATAGNGLAILLALLYLVCGVSFLTHPMIGLKALTLALIALFFFQALMHVFITFRIHAASFKFWNLFAAAFSLALAIFIFLGWPQDSIWVLGLLTGINLTFMGISHLFIGLSIKNKPN